MKNTKVLSLGMFLLFGSTAFATTHKVGMARGFSPSDITITLGDTIEFVNDSNKVHTVTADPALAKDPANVALPVGAEIFDSGNLKPADSFSHTFDVEGDYQYICIQHEKFGMMGRVHVNK